MSETGMPKQAAGRGLRIALAVSVALNLAVAGMFAGSLLKDHEDGGPRGVREIGFGPFSEALSREDRRALRANLMAKMPEMRLARREARALADEALRALDHRRHVTGRRRCRRRRG